MYFIYLHYTPTYLNHVLVQMCDAHPAQWRDYEYMCRHTDFLLININACNRESS